MYRTDFFTVKTGLLRTGLTSNHLERSVQYTYRLYKTKQDGTPNKAASSREILVFYQLKLLVNFIENGKRQ